MIQLARVIFSHARMESFATPHVKKNVRLFMNCLKVVRVQLWGTTLDASCRGTTSHNELPGSFDWSRGYTATFEVRVPSIRNSDDKREGVIERDHLITGQPTDHPATFGRDNAKILSTITSDGSRKPFSAVGSILNR